MDPLTNDERIAALLDGRLSEQERAELLAELGASDDDLELLVDSAGITRELEAEDQGDGIIHISAPRPEEAVPARVTRPPVWRRPAVLALAAAAVLVIGIAPFAWKASTRPDDRVFSHAVAELSHPDAAFPAGWSDARSETRGGGARRSGPATSARFGSLKTDLDRAVRAKDLDRAKEYAGEIADLLAKQGESGAVQEYARFATRSELPPADSLAGVLEPMPPTLDPENVRLGAWAEAARFAVLDRDLRFFSGGESVHYLRGRVSGLTSEVDAALGRVRAVRLGADGTDWDQLGQALESLLKDAT